MSTLAPAAKSKKKKSARPAGPPDERFWIKYSQNHELPLSVTSSLFIHALALGFVGLVLAGFLAGLFNHKRPPEVQPFAIGGDGGGGGDPNGSVATPGAEAINPGAEAAKQVNAKPEAIPPVEPKDLNIKIMPDSPLINPSQVVQRVEGTQTLSPANLDEAIKRAQARAVASRDKGKGGEGGGGGKGSGARTI